MLREGSSPLTGRSTTGKSTVFSSLRVCHRKHSKPERSGWRDAFTPLAPSLAGSQNRVPASGGIFPGISATCWRIFRTLGQRGIRVSNSRHSESIQVNSAWRREFDHPRTRRIAFWPAMFGERIERYSAVVFRANRPFLQGAHELRYGQLRFVHSISESQIRSVLLGISPASLGRS